MNLVFRLEKFLCWMDLKVGAVFTIIISILFLFYHLANASLILATGNDVWTAGQTRDRDGIDGLISMLNFMAAFISLIRVFYGVLTFWKGFERTSLEKYFFIIFTVNIYDSIEFILRMIVDFHIERVIGLPIFIIILWYTMQIIYSLLAFKVEEFRFGSQRKKYQQRKKADASSYGSINPHDDSGREDD